MAEPLSQLLSQDDADPTSQQTQLTQYTQYTQYTQPTHEEQPHDDDDDEEDDHDDALQAVTEHPDDVDTTNAAAAAGVSNEDEAVARDSDPHRLADVGDMTGVGDSILADSSSVGMMLDDFDFVDYSLLDPTAATTGAAAGGAGAGVGAGATSASAGGVGVASASVGAPVVGDLTDDLSFMIDFDVTAPSASAPVASHPAADVVAATPPLEAELEYNEDYGDAELSAALHASLDDGGPVRGSTRGEADGEGEHVDDGDDEPQEYNFAELPEHHCRYCGVHSPASVVKCSTCDRWFCNSRGGGSMGHIVMHLVRARHNTVSLHAEGPLGDTALECYNCGCNNVFLLGYIPAKQDSVVVLLCRSPCLMNGSLKDMDWDPAQWTPLIEDRCFLDWIVLPPSDEELMRSRRMPTNKIVRLEELWKTKPEAELDDLEKPGVVAQLEMVPDRFEGAFKYQETFAPLVEAEADYDKRMKEAQAQDNVQVVWHMSMNKKRIATFQLRKRYDDGGEVRIMPGDELMLRYVGSGLDEPWEGLGTVVRMTSDEEVALELYKNHDVPVEFHHDYEVHFVWFGATFKRMQAALKSFTMDETSVAPYIYNVLLGMDVEPERFSHLELPRKLNAPNLPELNPSQTSAVRTVLRRPFSLIQGPPGTGKTVTSATIVYHLATLHSSPVLVCAPSNVAVDQLTEKIHQTGLKVVRVAARSREAVDTAVDFLSLHKLVEQLAEQGRGELYKLMLLKEVHRELKPDDGWRLRKLKRAAERAILESADVICCTCSGAGDPRLKQFRFSYVLIDEATQATEPECIIPLVRGACQAVLVGDHRQLGPVVMCKEVSNAGLCRSLFERMIDLDLEEIKPVRLEVQYRMHPKLSEFPSNMFYDGSLQNEVSTSERNTDHLNFPWPRPDVPMFFYVSTGHEQYSASGTSYLNPTEAANVEKVVTQFLLCGVEPASIGVISPYQGQCACIINQMTRHGSLHKELYEQLEVSSVDAFQGREKDFIILSCVRSNEHQGIGFLNDPRRLNVALTRAKYGVVLVGNPMVLAKQPLWYALLTHFQSQGVLVEGTLHNLKPFARRLPRPRRRWRGIQDHSAYYYRNRAAAKAEEEDTAREMRRQQQLQQNLQQQYAMQGQHVGPGGAYGAAASAHHYDAYSPAGYYYNTTEVPNPAAAGAGSGPLPHMQAYSHPGTIVPPETVPSVSSASAKPRRRRRRRRGGADTNGTGTATNGSEDASQLTQQGPLTQMSQAGAPDTQQSQVQTQSQAESLGGLALSQDSHFGDYRSQDVLPDFGFADAEHPADGGKAKKKSKKKSKKNKSEKKKRKSSRKKSEDG